MFWSYKPYVSVAQRRGKAIREMSALRKKGRTITPIEEIEGRKIARTFWGEAWCKHIECLSDFESRLGRGRTYVKNGSVCHLEIKKGKIEAMVCGSELYEISVNIDALPKTSWDAIKKKCSGQIGSAVELLQGKFSTEVMTLLTHPDNGMFPHADDFRLSCNCPDFARLCKHLAAVLYGVGARLDAAPELLFTLRGVDHFELIEAAAGASASAKTSDSETISESDLADVFGIDMVASAPAKPKKPLKPKQPKAKKPLPNAKKSEKLKKSKKSKRTA